MERLPRGAEDAHQANVPRAALRSTGMLLHDLVGKMGVAVNLLHIIQLFQHLD